MDEKEFEKQWRDAINFLSKKGSKKDNEKEEEKPTLENDEIEYLEDIKQRYNSIFCDRLNRLHISIKINDHVECIPLDSKRFKSLIRKEILEKRNKTISDDKIDRIVKSIQAEKTFDENIEQKELFLRVAGLDDDAIYYDLTNQKWEIIKITHEVWQIVKNNEIPLFKRYERNSIPQVYPIKDIQNDQYFSEFLKLFNLRNQKDLLLFSVYLISAFIPDIPKPVLVISGN